MENQKNIFSTLVLEQNPSYVEELEKKYNIELPPIFKAFVQTFEFGKFEPKPEHIIIHPNEDLGFEEMDNNLEDKFKAYTEIGDFYQTPKVFPIIPSGIYSSGFCVGLSGDNTDKILINYGTIENTFEIVSPHILDFFSKLKEVHWDSV